MSLDDDFTPTVHLIVYSNASQRVHRTFTGFPDEDTACDWAEKHLPEDTWFHDVMQDYRPAMHRPVFEADTGDFCTECGLHSSAHDPHLLHDALAERSMKRIIEQGHQIMFIMPTEESVEDGSLTSPFWYTVGRTVKDRPELLVTGHLGPDVASYVINTAAALDAEGKLSLGEVPADTLLGEVPCRIIEADPEAASMNHAVSAFGDDVVAWQILWPDLQGRWPDEADFGQPEGFEQPVYAKEA